MELTPEENAQQRIHELLAELVEVIGPNAAGARRRWWRRLVRAARRGPDGKATLREWVVVGLWVDDDRDDVLTVLPAAGMLNHHTVGLLRAGLAYGHDWQRVDEVGDRS